MLLSTIKKNIQTLATLLFAVGYVCAPAQAASQPASENVYQSLIETMRCFLQVDNDIAAAQGYNHDYFASKIEESIKKPLAILKSVDLGASGESDMQTIANFVASIESIDTEITLTHLYSALTNGNLFYNKIADSPVKEAANLLGDINNILLMKSLPRIIAFISASLIEIIALLDQRLTYWTYQKQHQAYYFLHKSPLKWKINQKDEIKGHIKQIRSQKEHYYSFLGALSGWCASFVQNQDAYAMFNDQLKQFFAIADQALRPESPPEISINEIGDIEHFMLIVQAIKTRSYTAHLSGASQNSIVRHWMEYSAAGITVLGSVFGLYKKQGYVESAKTSLHSSFSSYITWQTEALKHLYTFIKSGGDIRSIKGNASQIPEIDSSTSSSNNNNSSSSSNGEINTSGTIAEDMVLTAKARDAIVKSFVSLRNSTKKEVLPSTLDQKLLSDEEENAFANDAMIGKNYSKVLSLLSESITNCDLIQLSGFGGKVGPEIASALAANIAYFQAVVMPDAWNNWARAKKYWGLTNQRITLLTEGIGTAAVLFAGYKLCRAAVLQCQERPHDLAIIAQILLEIDTILNNYDVACCNEGHALTMRDNDMGKLIYQLYRMDKQIRYTDEDNRWNFKQDVAQLRLNSILTIHQKRELIKIMQQKYDFCTKKQPDIKQKKL